MDAEQKLAEQERLDLTTGATMSDTIEMKQYANKMFALPPKKFKKGFTMKTPSIDTMKKVLTVVAYGSLALATFLSLVKKDEE